MSGDSDRNVLVRASGLPESQTDEAIVAPARILDAIRDGFVFLDREWRYVYVNARAGELFGRKPQDLIGKHIWTEFPEGLGQPLHLAYERAMREQVTIHLDEFHAQRGTWFEHRLQPSPDGLAILLQDVTERHVAEAERERAYAHIREDGLTRAQAERMAHLGFWRWDVATNRVEWSDELHRIYGRPEGEAPISFETYLSRVDPGDRARVRATIEAARADKSTFTMHERIARPDGSVRMLHSWGRVTLSPEGNVVGMLGTCLDMTPLIETTEALRQSEEWLSRALEGARLGLWDWDIGTNQVRWSQGVESLFGLPPGSFHGTYEAYLECVHPDDRARVVETIRRSVEEGGDYEVEHRVPLGDGSTRWLVCRGHVKRDEADKPVRMTGSVVDVTQRHLAEEERRLFALLVERASDFIGLASLDGRILYVNDAGLRMVGLASLAEARTKRVGEFLTPEGTKRSLEVELPAVLAHGHWEGEDQLVHFATGKRIDVLTTSFLIVDPATAEPSCLGTIRRDVTARRALEEQLRQSQKMEVVGRLSAGIAHDFNNLLTVILGMAGITLARGVAEERTRAAIEDIEAAGLRAADLTKQLAAFGRRQLLHPLVVDLNDVVGEAAKLLRRVLPVAIDLDLSLCPDVVPALVDRIQLEQVILNLVVNARDAMPEGGAITISTRTEGEHVILSVRDCGTGMTAEVRERVFEPFFTTKPEGKGTGLGLAMVYGIIHQSGGEVTLESEPGRGTVFEIRFPRATEPVAPRTPAVVLEGRVADHTILVVDDNEAVLATVRRILQEQGYCVLDTSLPENALRLFMAHAGTIDLILSDVRMPKMDGHELVRRCREISPAARVLFMSGDPGGDGTDALLSSDPVLAKPFMPAQLVERVRELLPLPGRKPR